MTPKSIALSLRPLLDKHWKATAESKIHSLVTEYGNAQLTKAAELIETGANGWVTENRYQISEQIRALRVLK